MFAGKLKSSGGETTFAHFEQQLRDDKYAAGGAAALDLRGLNMTRSNGLELAQEWLRTPSVGGLQVRD